MSMRIILGTVTALVLMALGVGCPKQTSPSHPKGDPEGRQNHRLSATDRACVQGLKPFFASERVKMDKNENQITKLQFYLSREVVLRRVLSSAEVKVTPQHRREFVKGKHYETIRIKCRTPGVVKSLGASKLFAAFDPKKTESVLPFEEAGEKAEFCLAGDWPGGDKEGTVMYEGKIFRTPASAKRSCLYLIKENKKTKTEKHRELKGIKLKDSPDGTKPRVPPKRPGVE